MSNDVMLDLTDDERRMLNGDAGEALQFAMELVVRAATIMRAPRLLETNFLHIDACHYYGRAHNDFARFFTQRDVKFEIPAWTNTVPVSLVQQEPREGAHTTALTEARELTELYLELGVRPVWTCAPYQIPGGPEFGDQIVVGESNAVSYYNSVVGARTNKYGDFLDVACGLTKRVPNAGLHTTEGRRATLQIDIMHLPEELRRTEFFCHVLGHFMGKRASDSIPVITGLPADTPKDSLKAIAAAGAASGGIALYHAVGITPEAGTLEDATQDLPLAQSHRVTSRDLITARDSLSTTGHGPIAMVALGTPHFSFTEFSRLMPLISGKSVHPDVHMYISTSRHVAALAAEQGWIDILERSGVTVLVDTCTYFSPAVRGCSGRVMTNSAKWAYYAPGMLPVEVAFGSLEDCVASAITGEVTRDNLAWSDKYWGAAA